MLNAALMNPIQYLTISTNTRAALLLDFNIFVREVLHTFLDLRVHYMKSPGAIAATLEEMPQHSGGRLCTSIGPILAVSEFILRPMIDWPTLVQPMAKYAPVTKHMVCSSKACFPQLFC